MYGNYEFKLAFLGVSSSDSTYYFLKTQVTFNWSGPGIKQGLAQFEKERKERKASSGFGIRWSLLGSIDKRNKEVLADYRPVKLVNGDITFNDNANASLGKP